MKAKKLMFGIMGAVAMITSANAITEEQCLKSSKMHWVSANKECIPRNACDSDRHAKDYCIRDFKDVEVPGVKNAGAVIEGYLSLKGINGVTIMSNYTGAETGGIQNYVAAMTGDGRYFVFEFDDTTNEEIKNEGNEENHEVLKIFCAEVGGTKSDDKCVGITEGACDKLSQAVQKAYSFTDSNKHYDSETRTCEMTVAVLRRYR